MAQQWASGSKSDAWQCRNPVRFPSLARCCGAAEGPRFSFPGRLFWRSEGGPFWPEFLSLYAFVFLAFRKQRWARERSWQAVLVQKRHAILATSPGFLSLYACFSSVQDPVWGPRFSFTGKLFGEAKAGHFGHQSKNSKPLCFYFSSVQKAMLGTGEILWEGPVFLPWQAFGEAKAGHFGHQPRISKPLCLCFSCVQKAH